MTPVLSLIVNITGPSSSWPLHALLWGGPLRAWALYKPSGRGARSLLLLRAAQWHRLEDSPDGITDGFCVRYVLLFYRIMSGNFEIPSTKSGLGFFFLSFLSSSSSSFFFFFKKNLLSVNFVNPTSEVIRVVAVVSTNLFFFFFFGKDVTWTFHCFLSVSTEEATLASHLCLSTFCCECSQTNLDECLQQPNTSQPWASFHVL